MEKIKELFMHKRIAYFIFLFSALVFVVSLSALFFFQKPLMSYSYYSSVNVSDFLGFDLTSGGLSFGSVLPGSDSLKYVDLVNNYSFPIVTYVESDGNIEQLLEYDYYTIVKPGETKRIPININTNNNTAFGFYNGTINFVVKPLRHVPSFATES